MNINIILAGVGGQGILTIAATLDTAALKSDLWFKQSEVHGMSQRGGAVVSHVRISDNEIYSDLIPMGKADMILSVEPMELMRYMPYLKENGWLITDSHAYENIPNYPDKTKLLETIEAHANNFVIDATSIAKKMGTAKMANIVLLGIASNLIDIEEQVFIESIEELFAHKPEKIQKGNVKAFLKGREMGVVVG